MGVHAWDPVEAAAVIDAPAGPAQAVMAQLQELLKRLTARREVFDSLLGGKLEGIPAEKRSRF